MQSEKALETARERNASFATERLIIMPASRDLLDRVYDYRLRSASYHEPWEKRRPVGFWSRESIELRLAGAAEDATFDRSYTFYVIDKADREPIIGSLSLSNVIRGAMHGAVLGYGLAPEVVGRGYMTEAVAALTEVAFSRLYLHRIEANIMPRNTRSVNVVRRAGFVEEGLQLRYLFIEDAWEDHLRFAKVNDAWEAPAWTR